MGKFWLEEGRDVGGDMINLASRILDGFKRFMTPSDAAWRGASKALWGLWLVLLALLLWGDLVHSPTVEKLLGLGAIIGVLMLVGIALLLHVWLFKTLSLGYRAALFFVFPLAFIFSAALWGPKGALAACTVVILSISLAAGGTASLGTGQGSMLSRVIAAALLVIGLGGLGLSGFMALKHQDNPNPLLADYKLEDRTLDLPDPGVKGPYEVDYFTYGSGNDRHRPEYAEEVTYVSHSVDGAKLVDKWSGPVGWVRTRYWGFDETELPLQGRVWIPQGEGPFPLVLVVHGNHGMENFSDPGYAYLGEHLASNGFIVVSVDENFLNSSTADMINPIDPGIGPENDARGWMLLEHLSLWRQWMGDDTHALHGKADMSRIGLIGHSRGGEAVAIAAAFNSIDHYPDDATLAFDYHFDIGGIIAIAPADGQYKPRKRPTPLKDINYFTIHGSMDGDVSSFMGSSQYSRVELTGEDFRFKSSLYITGANHGQFNTSWGRNDFPAPINLLLDTRPIMDPEDQRRIARVYFLAFFDTALNGNQDYLPLLEDARAGAQWLPDLYYINNYADTETTWLARFEKDLDPATGADNAILIEAANLSKWKESYVDLKWKPLDSHAAVLAWDERVNQDPGLYSIILDGPIDATDESTLVFSMADAGIGTLPKGFEPEGDPEEDADENEGVSSEEDDVPLDWTIVLVDSAGIEAALALSHDSPLYPQIKANTRRVAMLQDDDSSEIVMRRFALPLADFITANPDFDTGSLAEIRFQFDKSKRGAIVLDDIGIARH